MRNRSSLVILAGFIFVAVIAGLSGYALGAESHPRIHAAIRSIDDVIDYLKAAPHDFKGHRKAAVEASEAAKAELKKCLEVN